MIQKIRNAIYAAYRELDGSAVMTAEHDGKVYVVSESMDRRLARTEIMLAICMLFMGVLIVVGIYTLWRIDHNNLLGQILHYLKLARQACGTPEAWA